MKKCCSHRTTLIFFASLFWAHALQSQVVYPDEKKRYTTKTARDTTVSQLPYPFTKGQSGNLYLHIPAQPQVIYNRRLNRFIIVQKLSKYAMRPPVVMSSEAYGAYVVRQQMLKYYRYKSRNADEEKRREMEQHGMGLVGNLWQDLRMESRIFRDVLGGKYFQLMLQGYAAVGFSSLFQKVGNPQVPEVSRHHFSIHFDPHIKLPLVVQIGRHLSLRSNYDTQSTFSFENRFNLDYQNPDEADKILKGFSVGDVTANFRNDLIGGVQNLFGARTDLQFGKTYVSAVFSQHRSRTRDINIKGGSAVTDFDIRALDYEENTHYFLTQFFRDHYDEWLQNYPVITSGLHISRIEVWVLNTRSAATENTRNVLAFADLGERTRLTNPAVVRLGSSPFPAYSTTDPSKNANDIFTHINPQSRDRSRAGAAMESLGFRPDRDFVLIENAKLLSESEYRLNPQLGYLSLERPLRDDQVLAVSFQYVLNGNAYQLGEFSTDVDAPDNLVAKLLKRSDMRIADPIWDLMMKNIYDLGEAQIAAEGFSLDVVYRDDQIGTAVKYLPNSGGAQKITLTQLLHMDRLSPNGNPGPDGLFDYQPGITIDPAAGRLIFTVVEPFGSYLEKRLQRLHAPQEAIDRYVFQAMYNTSKPSARESSSARDKFSIKGAFRGTASTDGIRIGAVDVPCGSVRVTAAGRELAEGVDYIVDYQNGTLRLIDEDIRASGIPIHVSVLDNAAFNRRQNRFFSIDLEHRFNADFVLGATYLKYREKPLVQTANYGLEPVNNSILGFNGLYSKNNVSFLTDWIDKLPFVDTKVPSRINAAVNFAYLKPGSPKGIDFEGSATSYVDRFESTQFGISLTDWRKWSLASTPGGDGQTDFDGDRDDLSYGYHRAKMAWYSIDPLFYDIGKGMPAGITRAERSKNAVRQVLVHEVFPNRDVAPGSDEAIQTFDVTIFPTERGPYNFNPAEVNGIGDTQAAWAAIMRPMYTNNFEKENIQYLSFWLMDPFHGDQTNSGGDLYFQLGDVSEDILKDGKKQYENGLPTQPDPAAVESTEWGSVPRQQSTVYAFSTAGSARAAQDLGLDGLNDFQEAQRYGSAFGPDPSGDDYKHFLDRSYDARRAGIIERYTAFNGTQGNSRDAYPDVEDINRDQTMNRTERYYQYQISMRPRDLHTIGKNDIADIREETVHLKDGRTQRVKWYQFKVPIRSGKAIGGMTGFRSIRFMRLALKGFSKQTTLRFATLRLVRTDWRRFEQNLKTDDQGRDLEAMGKPDLSHFDLEGIDLVSNANRRPIPYTMPPGISRERLYHTTAVQDRNESSMLLRVRDLDYGDARAVYRYVDFDFRRYEQLDLFVHAERLSGKADLKDGDVVAFIRLGADMTDNYYEYEIPLKPTRFGSTSPSDIWPEENEIHVSLADFVHLKLERDQALTQTGKRMGVKGRPSLGDISVVMLGVRNRRQSRMAASAVVWFDALRVSGFDEQGGWAARANIDVDLADFARVSLSGTSNTSGFGGISEPLIDRAQDDKSRYSFHTRVNLDMLTPKKWGLHIPLNYSVAESFVSPEYNPLDRDVKTGWLPDQMRDSISRIANGYGRSTSLSLLHIRKDKTTDKPAHFYDVENFSLSYLYDQQYHRDVETIYQVQRDLQASVDYAYSFTPRWMARYLGGSRAFNFNPLPTRLSFRAAISRSYHQTQLRSLNPSPITAGPNAAFGYKFKFDYQYDIGFDFTRSFHVDFTSATNRIVKGLGGFNPYVERPDRDLIYKGFFNVGQPVHYAQQLRATWKPPLRYFSFLKWTDVDVSYIANYSWMARSEAFQWVGDRGERVDLGHAIQNSGDWNATASLNLKQLIDGVSFLRKSGARLNPMTHGVTANRWRFCDFVFMPFSGLRDAQLSYAKNLSSVIPGFRNRVGFFGRGSAGPNLGFRFGNQTDILQHNRLQRWHITTDTLANPYQRLHSENLSYQLMMQPLPALSIMLSGERRYTRSINVYDFNFPGKRQSDAFGHFFITHVALPATFKNGRRLFEDFKRDRAVIAKRLADRPTSQSVLIPAFLSACSGRSPHAIGLAAFRSIPIPNWTIAYTGLNRLAFVKKYVTQFEIRHAYRAAYSIDFTAASGVRPHRIYGGLKMEAFCAPLIGLDCTLKNGMRLSLDYDRDRMQNLSLTNHSLTESTDSEWALGFGYRIRNLKFLTRHADKTQTVRDNLHLKAAVVLNRNQVAIRKLTGRADQIITKRDQTEIRAQADYNFGSRLNLRLYYNQNVTKYAISTAFPVSDIQFGLSARVNFGS
ncbi:MAG: cell surface protein SprA [Flavobacteriales bacterium]